MDLDEYSCGNQTSNNHNPRIQICTDDLETDEAPMPQFQKRNLSCFETERNDSGFGNSLQDSSSIGFDRPTVSGHMKPVIGQQSTDYASSNQRDQTCFSEEFTSTTSDYHSADHTITNKSTDSLSLGESFGNLQLNEKSSRSSNCANDNGISSCGGEERLAQVAEVYTPDSDGDTQLHMSIIQMIEALALYFISIVPSPSLLNIRNNLQQTAMHLAVITNQANVVRRLMVGGADVDPKDNRGNTPLHIACIEGYQKIISHLVNPIQFEETKQNEYSIPYQQIPQDLEVRNYEGKCCMHLAAEKTLLPAIRMLLTKGANINAQDGKSGRTVLHYAAETGNRILLNLLLGYPALNLDAETYGGETALVLARGRGYVDIVSILKENGARYDSEDDENSEDEMTDVMYDDFCINGEPVTFT